MKKVLMVCAFVIGISAISFAQGRQRRSPADQAAALKTSLSLNDDQAAKITAIYTTQGKSTDSLMAAANGDFGAMREKMAPITAATNAKIKAVLTPDQATAFQKQVDERAAQMRARMGGN